MKARETFSAKGGTARGVERVRGPGREEAAVEKVYIGSFGICVEARGAIGCPARRGDMWEVCALDLPGKHTLKSFMLRYDILRRLNRTKI